MPAGTGLYRSGRASHTAIWTRAFQQKGAADAGWRLDGGATRRPGLLKQSEQRGGKQEMMVEKKPEEAGPKYRGSLWGILSRREAWSKLGFFRAAVQGGD